MMAPPHYSAHSNERTVLFILSANFSGSTYLALILGSHSEAAYVGELYKMFLPEPVPCRLCEERGEACKTFNDVTTTRPEDIHHRVFEKTHRRLIVDNSKTIDWSRKFLSESRFQRKYIHLIRDPRGLAFSMRLRDQPPDIPGWLKQNYNIRDFLEGQRCDYRTITYNEVAEETDRTLSELNSWLGLSIEQGQKRYWNFDHHGPGRNGATAAFLENFISPDKSFYDETKKSEFHDLRWKHGLDANTVRAITYNQKIREFLDRFGLDLSDTGLTRTRR
ncbi:MAG: hypothetical protein ACOYXU_09650 [Nitrospirota bacterium]